MEYSEFCKGKKISFFSRKLTFITPISSFTCISASHKNCLTETILMRSSNIIMFVSCILVSECTSVLECHRFKNCITLWVKNSFWSIFRKVSVFSIFKKKFISWKFNWSRRKYYFKTRWGYINKWLLSLFGRFPSLFEWITRLQTKPLFLLTQLVNLRPSET